MDQNIFKRFLSVHGIMFKVIHTDESEEQYKGLVNKIDGKNVVQFIPGSNVLVGDRLINPANEVSYVIDKRTTFINGKPMELTVFVQSEAEHNASSGVQMQLDSLRQLIVSKNSSDADQLNQIVDLLSRIASTGEPINQGALAKFSSVMERNSWITSSIASVLLSMMLQR